ncbi:Aflatoxin B1 aldehyde reductase member 2 [Peltigera leucophlebia]|nr:Aflatoxin B1 aldehyde reductase member 2 [Peltigera leucophlebia]
MDLVVPSSQLSVILGTMTFGPDESTARGYNEIDTARSYVGGKQEAFTAEAWKERGLTLATKVYPLQPGDFKPEVVKERLNISLKELKTDCVDIFYLHAADRSVPFEETLEAVNELHKEGKFVQLGLSNYTAFEVAEIVITCKERVWRYGLDVVIYNPLAGGLLLGKIKTVDIPSEGRYSENSFLGSLYRKDYFQECTFDALRLIETVAQKHNLTLLEVALRWVVHHLALQINNGRDGVVIGVSSFAQLEGNLSDLEKGPLPDEIVKALDEAWLITKPATPNYWHLDLKYTYDNQKALFEPKA